MGQQYRRKIQKIGFFSLHFDPEGPYIGHFATPKSWTFDNGTHPDRFFFTNYTYDNDKRNFYGTIDLDGKYWGVKYYVLNLTFTKDYRDIIEGFRYDYDENNEVFAFMDHSVNAPGDGYKYVIHHPVEALKFSQNCQVL